MHGVIEQIEWSQGVLVLVLNLLRRLLEAGKHGALAAGEVLAGITVLADLGKNLLHEDKLIRHKGEIAGKFPGAAETLDIQHGIGKGEQVPEHRIVGVVNLLQLRLHIVLLQQDTLLDNLIRRGGGQREAGLETRLNAGEFVLAGLDDFIHGFLTCADYPDLATTLAADVFHQRLQIDQQIGIAADVLADLVDHKQQAEVVGFAVHILLDLRHQLRDGGFHGLCAIEPVGGGLFAHAQHFHESGNDVVLKEGVGVAGLHPGCAVLLLKHAAELSGLALAVDELLQLGYLQVFAVVAQIGIEHLGENTQYGGLVLIDGAFDVDVEQDRIRMAGAGRAVDQHEGSGVICQLGLMAEALHGADAVHLVVLQQVGQHLQEVGFTTAEEAGNPYADICGRSVERLQVVVEESDDVLLKLPGDDILIQFLHQDIQLVLVDLDDTVNRAINAFCEHVLYSHAVSPPQITLNAR